MNIKQGLLNFSRNIKPTMEKCRAGKRLTKEEKRSILEYYLEVLYYLARS